MDFYSAPLDFLGVNYYSRAVVAHDPDGWLGQHGVEVDAERTDMGSEVYPAGLSGLLRYLAHDYELPKTLPETVQLIPTLLLAEQL